MRAIVGASTIKKLTPFWPLSEGPFLRIASSALPEGMLTGLGLHLRPDQGIMGCHEDGQLITR